jgi:hypothetical protein
VRSRSSSRHLPALLEPDDFEEVAPARTELCADLEHWRFPHGLSHATLCSPRYGYKRIHHAKQGDVDRHDRFALSVRVGSTKSRNSGFRNSAIFAEGDRYGEKRLPSHHERFCIHCCKFFFLLWRRWTNFDMRWGRLNSWLKHRIIPHNNGGNAVQEVPEFLLVIE